MCKNKKAKENKSYKDEKLSYFDRQKEQLPQFQKAIDMGVKMSDKAETLKAEHEKLTDEYCSLEKKYKELKERYDKIVRQECIISDHCLHCKNASVVWNYYGDRMHLITCDIFHSCVHYKRADAKEDERESDLDKQE